MAESHSQKIQEMHRLAVFGSLERGRTPDEIEEFFGFPRSTVDSFTKQYLDGEELEKETARKMRRRLNVERFQETIRGVDEALTTNPKISVDALAERFNSSKTAISRIIDEDLRFDSYKSKIRQTLAPALKARRLEICRRLLTSVKNEASRKLRFFSSEKAFVRESNHQKHLGQVRDSDYVTNVEEPPAGVLILSIVSSEGDVMAPYFFAEAENVDTTAYLGVLARVNKPWLEHVAAGRLHVFQQDESPTHSSPLVQTWLDENLSSFWSKDLWPPSSPDINPFDYYIWGAVEREVNKKQPRDTSSLTRVLRRVFHGLQRDILKKTCRRFRQRIEAVIQAGGSYIE